MRTFRRRQASRRLRRLAKDRSEHDAQQVVMKKLTELGEELWEQCRV